MLNIEIAAFYERDIRRFIEEIILFKSEENLWKIQGAVKNSAGNLALHIIGGLNHLIGANLANSGYLRNRSGEFDKKGVEQKYLVEQLEALIPMIIKTIHSLGHGQMESKYPVFFDKDDVTISYVLLQLLIHLNYHLGQVNYLRRMLE